jgi:hypothetical protein
VYCRIRKTHLVAVFRHGNRQPAHGQAICQEMQIRRPLNRGRVHFGGEPKPKLLVILSRRSLGVRSLARPRAGTSLTEKLTSGIQCRDFHSIEGRGKRIAGWIRIAMPCCHLVGSSVMTSGARYDNDCDDKSTLEHVCVARGF